jgi:hypothetical protein
MMGAVRTVFIVVMPCKHTTSRVHAWLACSRSCLLRPWLAGAAGGTGFGRLGASASPVGQPSIAVASTVPAAPR